MHFTKEDLERTEKIRRLNLINSITGIKPANLIGTLSKQGVSNLAIFSSIIHLGSNPGLIGFILRPKSDVPRHTYENIMETEFYTINHLHYSYVEKGHKTSAKYNQNESEFLKCGFNEEYLPKFHAPFVKESPIKIGMKFKQKIPISLNNTTLIIGEIQHIVVSDDYLTEEGYINLQTSGSAGISGLNSYYKMEHLDSFPYARV